MSGESRIDGGPRSVVVVGAGVVGLSTAWFLQEHGVEVTVVDRDGVAAGASWGNAGWVSPALTAPLNSPGALREGLQALTNPMAPLHIPMRADTGLARFLLQFALNCRPRLWEAAARANAVLNNEAIETFDELVTGGVDAPVTDTSVAVALRSAEQAKRFLAQLAQMPAGQQPIQVDSLSGPELHDHVPLASAAITTVITVHGQRFVDPGRFTQSLGQQVIDRGATLRTVDVVDVTDSGHRVAVTTRSGDQISADAAVLASGAWLPQLTDGRIRVRLQAGRGYSFTVPVDRPLPGPIYLPEVRVACTPYRGALRVAGTMEFRRPSEPLMQRRVDAIVAAAAPLLDGVRWDERRDVWVGSRPVTADGRPLIGELAPRTFVAGGHGMWGLAHGPVTGRLLAEQIVTGKQTEALRAFDPRR